MRKILKRCISLCLCAVCLALLPLQSFAESPENAELPPMPIEVDAKAAILADVNTGKVLMAKNAHDKLYPASITKIMTLLLVTEALDSGKISPNDIVTASHEASKKGGSQIWLKEGETMTVDELLKATAVASANDASEALAEYVAGSTGAFVQKMNQRAKELGMLDTNFENCTGLDDTADRHMTSAYDVMLMSRELLMHPRVTKYTCIWMDSLRDGKTELVNTNKMVRFYDGATGLKTGTTVKAGCCVSASAKRGDTHLVAVVLGSSNSKERFKAAREMLDWGFANYETLSLPVDETQIVPVQILKGKETSIMPTVPEAAQFLIEKGQRDNIEMQFDVASTVEAPVEKGQLLGKVYVKRGDMVLYTYNLLSPQEIQPLSFHDVFLRILCVLCG